MPLFEIGYRRYEGPLTHPNLRWWPITRTGIQLAWGNKLLRRVIYAAHLPLLYFAPFFFAIGRITEPKATSQPGFLREIAEEFLGRQLVAQLQDDPSNVRTAVWSLAFAFFLRIQLFLALIVATVVAPPLISSDLRTRAFLIYFARPVSRLDYLLGKLGVLVVLLGAVTLLPSLALYALSILFSPALDTVLQTLPVLGSVVASSLALILPVAALSLALSSATTQARFAAVGWIVICAFGPMAHGLLSASREMRDAGWTFLLSLPHTLWSVQVSIFDVPARLERVEGSSGSEHLKQLVRTFTTEHSFGLALTALALIVALSLVALYRRTGAPTRI